MTGDATKRPGGANTLARRGTVSVLAALTVLSAIPCRGDTIVSIAARRSDDTFSVHHVPTAGLIEEGTLTGDPVGIGAPADGSVVYMLDAQGELRSMDTELYSWGSPATGLGNGIDTFNDLAVLPDGTRLYGLSPTANHVVVYDPALEAIVTTIPIATSACGMVLGPGGGRLYVAHTDLDSVTVIDTASAAVIGSITVDDGPSAVTVLPDGSKLYVATQHLRVSVVDLSTNLLTDTIPVPSIAGREMIPTASGHKVYVVGAGGDVVAIDTTSHAVATVPSPGTGVDVGGIASSPDPGRVYLSTGTGILAIDTATNQFAERIRKVPVAEQLLVIAAGVCGNGLPPCDGSALCAPQVAPVCQPVGRGLLSIYHGFYNRDHIKMRLLDGPALTQADFGNPLVPGGTAYALCIYNAAGDLVLGTDVDRAGDSCFGGLQSCWRAAGGEPPLGKGYSYREFHTESYGYDSVLRLTLRSGTDGSKVQLNAGVAVPARTALGLAGDASATMQFVGSNGLCLGYTLDDIKENVPAHFRSK